MTTASSSPTQRSIGATGAVSMLLTLLGAGGARPSKPSNEGDTQMKSDVIRPFSFHASEAELTELHRRINATR